jgi:hypothetical protein
MIQEDVQVDHISAEGRERQIQTGHVQFFAIEGNGNGFLAADGRRDTSIIGSDSKRSS